jgi:hypothetical protein
MLDIQTSIQSLSALRRLYEDRVNQDNCQSGTNPIYLPNPIFTNAPKYGLIAMEPSLNRMTPETFQTLIVDSTTFFILKRILFFTIAFTILFVMIHLITISLTYRKAR